MRNRKLGFTLVEMMIVAGIIALIAGIAIPALNATVEDAEAASTEQELQRIRTAVDYYRFQHNEAIPGYDNSLLSWNENAFVSQLIKATNDIGDWAKPGTNGYPYGPYLPEGVPRNPYNELTSIAVVAPGENPSYPDDSTGWVYYATDGSFRANSTEKTPTGENVWDL